MMQIIKKIIEKYCRGEIEEIGLLNNTEDPTSVRDKYFTDGIFRYDPFT